MSENNFKYPSSKKCSVCKKPMPAFATIFGRNYCLECALKRKVFDVQPYYLDEEVE